MQLVHFDLNHGEKATHQRNCWQSDESRDMTFAEKANDDNLQIGKNCIIDLILATKACETHSQLPRYMNDVLDNDLPSPFATNHHHNGFIQRLIGSGKCFSAFAQKAKDGHHKTRVDVRNSPARHG
jgi:hypothetical protein